MTHITLINTQLLTRCPEALCLSCVVKEQPALDEALSFLRAIPAPDRLYTKLIHHQEACKPQHFYFMTTAAKIIASYYNKSYLNYRNNEVIQRMEVSLIKYLNAKTAAGGLAIMGSVHNQHSASEREFIEAFMNAEEEPEETIAPN